MVGKKRLSLGMVLTLFLCLAAVGTTFAYLYSETNILTNAFSMGKLNVEIIENGNDPGGEEHNIVPKNIAQKQVKVENKNGNVKAYVRVAIVPTIRTGTAPNLVTTPLSLYYQRGDADVKIICDDMYDNLEGQVSDPLFYVYTTPQALDEDVGKWLYDKKTHFFYYSLPIAPGESTTTLLDRVEKGFGEYGDWNQLHVEVMADAIQADFEGDLADHPVSAQWPVTVGADGKLSLN